MIIEGLVQLLTLLVLGVTALLPSYAPPKDVSLNLLAAADWLLPVSELALFVGALCTYAVASLGYVLVVRLVNWIRGAG